MSWKGFTKAMARLPHVVMKKAGTVAETVDEDFVNLEVKFEQIEQTTNKFVDDLKKYRETMNSKNV